MKWLYTSSAQNSTDNLMKNAVVDTLDKSFSFQIDAIESCRVFKANLKHNKCPLFQGVANGNESGKILLQKHR